jgi:hypothetical protein
MIHNFYSCDRCGADTVHSDYDDEKVFNIFWRVGDYATNSTTESTSIDLCNDCLNELRNFFKPCEKICAPISEAH